MPHGNFQCMVEVAAQFWPPFFRYQLETCPISCGRIFSNARLSTVEPNVVAFTSLIGGECDSSNPVRLSCWVKKKALVIRRCYFGSSL